MNLTIASFDITDLTTNGCLFELRDGGPWNAVPVFRGERVLIPGRDGLYTPDDNFEPESLLIRYHGFIVGSGATNDARRASFASRTAAFLSACAADTRADVVLSADGYTINAGFVRTEGPSPAVWKYEGWEFDLEFMATDPPEWEQTGS